MLFGFGDQLYFISDEQGRNMQKWSWSFHAEYFWWLKFAIPLRFDYDWIIFGSIVVLNSFFFFSAEGHEMPKGARYPCNNSVFSKRPDCGGRVRLKLVSHLGLLLNSLVSVGRQHQLELLWKLCRVGHIRWWQHGSQDSSTDSLLCPSRGTSGKVWRPPSPSDSSSWADERPCEARSSPD